MLSAFIMTVFPCVWSENGRTCGYSFTVDGHNKCVTHRPCVSGEFIYNPLDCDICSPNIDFLSSVEVIDKSCMQFICIKDSWSAVRRAARRKQISALWYDLKLHDMIFGRARRASSLPRPVSAPIPLVELGAGTDSVVLTVSSPSHVEVEPHVFPSFSEIVSETGLSESGSDFPGFSDVPSDSIPCAQPVRVETTPPGVGRVPSRRGRSPSQVTLSDARLQRGRVHLPPHLVRFR